MPADSRWDLIQGLKGLKNYIYSNFIRTFTLHSLLIFLATSEISYCWSTNQCSSDYANSQCRCEALSVHSIARLHDVVFHYIFRAQLLLCLSTVSLSKLCIFLTFYTFFRMTLRTDSHYFSKQHGACIWHWGGSAFCVSRATDIS